ncbi:MAG TPA: FtsW/RodA/SpoVE family cell cycle protein [Candidatus Saccharimonadales bacterium]|nr:FtsW/RodA/SpoVE family cell cycle protein [Candidatus Saccharimonadales bacterium]
MQTAKRLMNRVKPLADGAIRRHRPDYQIVLYMGLLMLLGLVVMYAIGPQRANVLNNSYNTDFYTSTYFFIKQTVSLLLALAAFVALAVVPFKVFKANAGKILVAGLIACVILFIAGNLLKLGIAQCSLGACRWFDLGPLGSIQPAEFLKFGLLVFTAGFLAMRAKQGLINDLHKTMIPLGVLVLVSIFFVIGLQKDMGTGIAMVSIIASIMAVAGVSKKVGLVLLGAGVLIGIILIIIAPHRVERVATFLQGDQVSEQDANDQSYHITHAKIAIGSGGLTGVGIGNSVQATGYLPEAINDSVFAIMGETFGFVGLVIILALFTALLMRLLKIADHLPDLWMRLTVAGVFGWLAAHVILNVAAMIGVFPLTGITLPLLSFGGTSMIFIAGALGLAFQLSRYTMHGPINKENSNESTSSRRGLGRTRYAGYSRSTRA